MVDFLDTPAQASNTEYDSGLVVSLCNPLAENKMISDSDRVSGITSALVMCACLLSKSVGPVVIYLALLNGHLTKRFTCACRFLFR